MGKNLYSQGEKLQLNCLSDGGPVLEYTWLHSGSIIPNANTDILIIDNANTTDVGEYICNVTNNAGNDSDNITVYSKLTKIYISVCDQIISSLMLTFNFSTLQRCSYVTLPVINP